MPDLRDGHVGYLPAGIVTGVIILLISYLLSTVNRIDKAVERIESNRWTSHDQARHMEAYSDLKAEMSVVQEKIRILRVPPPEVLIRFEVIDAALARLEKASSTEFTDMLNLAVAIRRELQDLRDRLLYPSNSISSSGERQRGD